MLIPIPEEREQGTVPAQCYSRQACRCCKEGAGEDAREEQQLTIKKAVMYVAQ